MNRRMVIFTVTARISSAQKILRSESYGHSTVYILTVLNYRVRWQGSNEPNPSKVHPTRIHFVRNVKQWHPATNDRLPIADGVVHPS